MQLVNLRIHNLRCLTELSVDLGPGFNVFSGANGAGKTSVLEAVFLLSHARSFRSGARDALLRRGAAGLSVFAEIRHDDGRCTKLGLGREGPRWQARADGATVSLGDLVRECAVVCFEPGSHALIAGGAEERRRFLDWGVFHVEHDFLAVWRRYQRALKQRNSLLRSASLPNEALFEPWEIELAQTASLIDDQRRRYLDALRPRLSEHTGGVLSELGAIELRYRRGWPDEIDLANHLAMSRIRDRGRGHTAAGAHRADWSIAFEHAPLREHLSRGQEKLTALACLLAQASLYAEGCGTWPIICLDDLASELDQAHQAAVVTQLAGVSAQVLITGTEVPEPLRPHTTHMFHVEQGHLTPLL